MYILVFGIHTVNFHGLFALWIVTGLCHKRHMMFRLCSLIVWWNWSMVILSMWNTYFYRINSPGLITFTRQKNFILWFQVNFIFDRWSFFFFFFGSGLVYFALILHTHQWFFISVVSWLNPSHWSFEVICKHRMLPSFTCILARFMTWNFTSLKARSVETHMYKACDVRFHSP